jgi:hypothetical protein
MPLGIPKINVGIPPLLNAVSDNVSFVSLLVADAVIFARMMQSHTLDNPEQVKQARSVQWGIYEGDNQIIFPDSIVSLDVKREWSLPNYPMEQGAFQTYNKVATPTDVRVRMTFAGTELQQKTFLDKLDELAGSVRLFDVVTKGRTYLKMNIKHYDMKRTATNGAGMLTVDVALQEVRNTIVASFTNTKLPDAKTPQGSNVKPRVTQSLPADIKAKAQ